VSHIKRTHAFTTSIAAPFISTASHLIVESVRFIAKLRGARDRPPKLATSYGFRGRLQHLRDTGASVKEPPCPLP
jgi:hypothetical protein